MEVKPEVWEEVRSKWADIRAALEAGLATESMKRFDDGGNLVDSDRPMLESIVCDFQEKSPRFFLYLMAAMNVPAVRQSASGKRIIEVGTMTPLPLATGGKEENVRK